MNALRVAVLGASGIGRNHARWLHGHGCEVVAFLGSSPQSVARTSEKLRAEFPFAGRGYTNLEELLETEAPQAVVVSTPPHLHFQDTVECMIAGAHVLCEKPLFYDAELGEGELLRETSGMMVHLARVFERVLAVQTQYVMLAPDLLRMCDVRAEEVREFAMFMETRNSNAGAGRDLWLDLAPHPLSVLLALCGLDAQLQNAALQLREHEARAEFSLRRADGSSVQAQIRVAFKADNPLQRRFVLNDRAIDIAGRLNLSGDYRIFLNDGAQEIERRDLVDELIGTFVGACRGEQLPIAISGEAGARNLDLCLTLLETAA